MSGWFRVYSELLDDPKFIKLGPDQRSALVMMWCVAADNGGRLPALDDIAIKFRLSEARTKKLLDELKRNGFIDDDSNGSTPHNWNGRQYKTDVSTDRVQRYRKRQRNVSPTVSETFQETPGNGYMKRNSSVSVSVPSLSSSATSLGLEESEEEQACGENRTKFDEFWEAYPNKVGKKHVQKQFVEALKIISFEKLMDGLRLYKNKTDDRPWCNPATWLHQGRWDDQPAQQQPRGGVLGALDKIERDIENGLDREASEDAPLGLPSR